MHVTFDSLKTFYNILVQKLKNHRGNWEQNDPDADDYIKNRPFYSEGIQETIIIDTIVNFDNSSSDMVSSGPTIYQIMIDDYPVNSFKIGETYTVIWDNQTYECVAQDVDGIGVIGNASLIGYMESVGYEDTGEPFLIGAEQDYGYTVLSTEDSNHTLIVKTVTEVIKKLDKKFIDMPDDIVTNEEFNDAIDYIDDQINNLSSVAFSGNYYDLNNRPTIYSDIVRYNSQYLTDTQKQTARNNIGAGTSNFSGKYTDLTNAPEILQANWEMYNPNSNAYIANKPFGYEYELEDLPLSSTEIKKLCSGTFDENTGLYVTEIIFNRLPQFKTFEDYYFVVNGKPNISKFCQYRVSEYNTSQLYLGVGNASLTWGVDGLGELRDYKLYQEQSGQSWYNVKDTGEDWFLGQRKHPNGTYYTFITRKPNIQITGVHRILSETFNQLDEKFIPDTIARVDNIPQTDWNQNDETAADFVKNKPFGIIGEKVYEPLTITWDGDTTDRISISLYNYLFYYKVSDLTPTLEQLQFGSSGMFGDDSEMPLNFVAGQGMINVLVDEENPCIYIALEDGASLTTDVIFPEKGIYFTKMGDIFVKNLTISGGTAPIIQTIDSNFLPIQEIIGPTQEIANTALQTANSKMNRTDPVGEGKFGLNHNIYFKRGDYSFTEGQSCAAIGTKSHAEGYGTWAYGTQSHAEGYGTFAYGDSSHIEGVGHRFVIRVTGAANTLTYTLSEDYNNQFIKPGLIVVSQFYSSVGKIESYDPSTLSLTLSSTLADRDLTNYTVDVCIGAIGIGSHSEGYRTNASAMYSHAEGSNTIADGDMQHVQGKCNIQSPYYAHIVGNGTSDNVRSNAHTLDWEGNAWYQGDVYVGSTSGTNKDSGSKKLATEEFVNNKGYLTSFTETDPTVPAWAKSPTKPTYTASEVGAYSKTEIDDMVFITVDDIDAICVKIIEFSISNIYGEITKYQAKDGMTWAEWIVSDYNTTGLTAEEMTIRDINHNEVETTSAIQEGVLYEEIPIKRAAGLYRAGTNFGELIYTWDELIEKGAVQQDDTGRLYYFQLPDDINREGDIVISDTVTFLANQCLAGGVSSDTIIVPSSVTTIEDNVFENVKNVIIPASVTAIACTAFSLAQYKLKNIYYEGSQAQWKNINLLHFCFGDECGGINTYDATIHYNYTE